jgi:N-acetylglutamate synthase-like GNAT family acetyltransferase
MAEIVNIDDARKPVFINNPAAQAIMGNLFLRLLDMHAKHMDMEHFCGDEMREWFTKQGFPRNDIDQVMDFLITRWKQCSSKDKTS